jgi:hypothetical protein
MRPPSHGGMIHCRKLSCFSSQQTKAICPFAQTADVDQFAPAVSSTVLHYLLGLIFAAGIEKVPFTLDGKSRDRYKISLLPRDLLIHNNSTNI